MSPKNDIRTIAGSRDLRELLFQLVWMLNQHFDTGFILKLFTDFGQAVIAFIAVNPDNQFAFFNFSERGRGENQCRQCRKGEGSDA
jgi:hypothetical protein